MGIETSMSSELVYGHWGFVVFYSFAWSIIIFVLIRPRMLRELGVFALLTLFLIDEFTELYGVPLSTNLVSRWLGFYPQTDLFLWRGGELWRILFRQPEKIEGLDPYYVAGGVLIFGGLGVLYYAWRVLEEAQASGVPAVMGPYAWARHPQYLALISIMLGFVISGPTLLILAMFPIVTYLYVLLARREEQEALTKFGPAYALYMKRTPRFIP
jgi:methanethiol S-methyltransferase